MPTSDDPGRPSAKECEAALQRLPEVHALALRLHHTGAPDDVICRQLRIEPQSLSTLLDVAQRKLDAILSKQQDENRPPG